MPGGTSRVAYGVELVNVSYEHDAVGVSVMLQLRDAHGRSLGRRSLHLGAVSAATTFFVAGRMPIAAGADAEALTVAVRLRASGGRRLFLPVAADVQLRRDRAGRLGLTGRLTASSTALTARSRIYAVIFDDAGRIVGGGEEAVMSATGTEVAPGQTAAFELPDLSPTPARRALFAGVSIEP